MNTEDVPQPQAESEVFEPGLGDIQPAAPSDVATDPADEGKVKDLVWHQNGHVAPAESPFPDPNIEYAQSQYPPSKSPKELTSN